MMGTSTTPSSPARATAVLVVPRSIPTGTCANLVFQLPAPPVTSHAVQLGRAQLRHPRLDRDRHLRAGVSFERGGHGRDFLELGPHLVEERSRGVVLADRGGKKAELGRLADHEPE